MKQSADQAKVAGLPVERGRREIRLLDEMYKTAIVLIMDHYVKSTDDLPAGETFKLMYQPFKKRVA